MTSARQHLGVYELVELFRARNNKTQHDIRKHIQKGAVSPKRSKKNRDKDGAIANLHRLYSDGKMTDTHYLFGIQANLGYL